MKRKRKQLIHWLFEKSMTLYCKFKKKEAWGITSQQLLALPGNTLGFKLGQLLHSNNFELIPKVERHDAYHLVTGFGTTVEDEIALQYCCFGNGKRTPYLLGVLFLGSLILPDYMGYYLKAFRFGKDANSFHHFDYKTILEVDFEDFRSTIFTNTAINEMKSYQLNPHRG